jgi:glycosyl transferase family 25
MLDCYIINLDCAHDRWNASSEQFRSFGLNVIRIPTIEGKDLTFPHPDFAPWRFFFWYGRQRVPNEVACFFSHIKALKTFLATDKKHAMICEDDVLPLPELMDVVYEAMCHSQSWDLLRLNAIKPTHGYHFATLSHGFQLCCDLKTSSGSGAYIVNRHAAEAIIKKHLPMTLVYDVALFYDWSIGLREVTVQPFPVLLNKSTYTHSTIGTRTRYPLLHPVSFRHIISLPYRICSRTSRKISRIRWAIQCRFHPPQPHVPELEDQ